MPDIELESIQFNHNTNSLDSDAMNIRRNYDEEIIAPEWHKAMIGFKVQSMAAYAIEPIKGNTVTVKATFSLPIDKASVVEIKAEEAGGVHLLGDLPVKIISAENEDPHNPGHVRLSFELIDHKIKKVGVYNTIWTWKYRLPQDLNWQDLCLSRHRIYVVLDIPGTPWNQNPADNFNPWTEILDISCSKAAGKSDSRAAARAITKSIYSDYGMLYDTGEDNGSGGQASYLFTCNITQPGCTPGAGFMLEEWLSLNLGNTVNCVDCACLLKTLGNIIGCGLRMMGHTPFGYLNPVVPIGRDVCNNPFYASDSAQVTEPLAGEDDASRTYFFLHSYTWLDLRVYDATMKVFTEPSTGAVLGIVLVWFILMIFSFGKIGTEWLTNKLDKLNGWLVDHGQIHYRNLTIDDSTPEEAAQAGVTVIEGGMFIKH